MLAPHPARAEKITDDANRSVTIPSEARRVFPAGLPAAILIYTLAPELLLGWPRANRAEECAFLLAATCRKPVLDRLTARDSGADSATVIALNADLIVDVGSTSSRYAVLAESIQQETGIPYALLDGRVLSLSTSYEKMGRLIGREGAGADFADYCNQTLSVVTNRIAFVPAEKRPRIYYARGPAGVTTGLAGASQMENIELLARNVAGGSRGGLAEVTADQVREWEPDVVLATDPRFAAHAHTDAAWSAVKAVRDARVYQLPRLPFGWVDAPPSANRLLGLWWLAKLLYPEHFKEDLREVTRDFFAKFYHVTPSAAQIERLLSNP
jgi:iron complex transport system substrate-binding protein